MPNEPTETLVDNLSFADLKKLVADGDVPEVETPKPTPEAAKVPATLEPVAAAAEPPAAEPEPTTEAEGTTAEPKQEPKPEKKPHWTDKRISELSQKRREAEARATAEHDRAEQLARELEALKTAQPGPGPQAADKAPTAPPPAAGKPKPQLKDFVTALDSEKGEEYDTAVERFSEALSDWKDEQRTVRQQESEQQTRLKAQESIFREDWKQALEETPDFEDVVARVREATPEQLQIAISQVQDAEGKNLWPKINIYLDENPEELKTLVTQFRTNPLGAVARLGRLGASLSTPGTPPAPKPITQIPPKTTPPRAAARPPVAVGGTAAPSEVDINTVKDLDVIGRELKKQGLEIPGF